MKFFGKTMLAALFMMVAAPAIQAQDPTPGPTQDLPLDMEIVKGGYLATSSVESNYTIAIPSGEPPAGMKRELIVIRELEGITSILQAGTSERLWPTLELWCDNESTYRQQSKALGNSVTKTLRLTLKVDITGCKSIHVKKSAENISFSPQFSKMYWYLLTVATLPK